MGTLSNVCYNTSQTLNDLVSFQNGGLVKTIKFSSSILKLANFRFFPLFNDAASDLSELWNLLMTRDIVNATPKLYKNHTIETVFGFAFCSLNFYDFLKYNELFSFQSKVILGSEMRSYSLIGDIYKKTIGASPYIENLVAVPRNICIFALASQNLYNKVYKNMPGWKGSTTVYVQGVVQSCSDPRFICPLLGSGGKLLNLFLVPHKIFGKGTLTERVISAISSTASIILHIYECNNKRAARTNQPDFTAPAA